MKKLFSLLLTIFALTVVGCQYDDSDVLSEIDSLKNRVLTLEQLCAQMNTNISSLQALVNAVQENDSIKSVTPINEGGNVVGYTITFTKSTPITIYHGQNGENGQNGTNGENGKDGHSPIIGVKQDADSVYYWTLDGNWLLDDDGNKIKAQGTDGKDGVNGTNGTNGADGKDGVVPKLKIENEYWYVSYDDSQSWTQLDKATGDDGADGDSFFESVEQDANGEYVEFVLVDGTEIKIPMYKPFEVEIATPERDYVKIGDSTTNITVKYTVKGCDTPSVVVVSNLKTKLDKSANTITIYAPASKDGLEDKETVTLMVSNGSTTIMDAVDINIADVVAATQDELASALTSSGSESVSNVLGEGEYKIPYLTNTNKNSAIRSLTIIGTKGSQITFDGGNATLEALDQLTIQNCEILKMATKSWGMIVFNASSNANGVYTISNCTFNGVITQGIYINENASGAVYNIENCTFNGDFGGEGAITIQNNAGVKSIINVTGCTFNNIPSTSHKISMSYSNTDCTLNIDENLNESDIWCKETGTVWNL